MPSMYDSSVYSSLAPEAPPLPEAPLAPELPPLPAMVALSRPVQDMIATLNKFRHKHFRISNLEMETSGIYGLGHILGHQCLSVSAILADRVNNTFSMAPQKTIDKMIVQALELITA